MKPKVSIAYFVSAHGFGHAARASAVLNAAFEKWPYLHADLFTTVPEWFFADSLNASFSVHHAAPDIGLVQRSPLEADLGATVARLDGAFPLPETDLENLAHELRGRQCRLVVSDISPWGIAAAEKANLPSLLIENFTWDWIYEGCLSQDRRFKPHVDYLRRLFAAAGHRIQARPFCAPFPGAALAVPPVGRKPKTDRAGTRRRLGLDSRRKMVLITMGGVPDTPAFIAELAACEKDIHFVLPGAFSEVPADGERRDNVTLLPHRSAFYHPDLVHAADAVVGKAGYSTLAEVYQAGVPFGFVSRPDFPEARILESFIKEEMAGLAIDPGEFETGAWLKKLPRLLSLPAGPPKEPNGADVAADYITRLIASDCELLEVVDPRGNVCGAAPRREIHGNCDLLHQVVHVLVFDSHNRLLLQKRSRNKTVAPGKWDTSVGGHVDCGETIETAMRREMAEELGIEPAAPKFAYQYIHANDFESELVYTFVCQFDGEPRFNPEEIEAAAFWTPSEIDASLGKGLFSDNFEHEYFLYRQWSGK